MTTLPLVLSALLIGAAVVAVVVAWRRRTLRTVVVAVSVAVLAVFILAAPTAAAAAAVPVALLVAALLTVWLLRRTRTSALVGRWGARSRRTSGVATTVDIARTASWVAMRRKATTVRPSLGDRSRRDRWRIRSVEHAVPLCRVGLLRVWSSVEDVTLIFGGPRTGKTGWLAGRVIDAPGALLVTSTRTDLHQLTAGLRSRCGPVYVFNAVGLAGLASTITFDPLTGCADPVTAAERATDLLGACSHGGGGDREFWDAQARRVLAALLHAAALGDGIRMLDVLRWVADPDKAQQRVLSLLRRSPEPSYSEDAAQFLTTNDRTRSSITSTIMPALGWLTSPAASAAASGDIPFNVAKLLTTRATVYLLGAEETQAAPLVCALTGHIAREARRIAAHQTSGRLDPPLTLALDEAALISPVPLDRWSADMGGRGVTIIAAFQSRAQMLDRYGDAKTAATMNNTGSIMVFGGTRDRDDLNYWSTLAGERDEPVATTSDTGKVTSRSVRKVPVLAPAQLANLPIGRVVVFRRGMPPVIGRVAMAWNRRDVRAQTEADRSTARSAGLLAAWTAEPVAAVDLTKRKRPPVLDWAAIGVPTTPFVQAAEPAAADTLGVNGARN